MTNSSAPRTKKENDQQESSKKWIDLINESVHTSDDIDIGDIIAVSRDLVVVKRGFVNVHYAIVQDMQEVKISYKL
jgi:precorrin isomerase